MIESCKRAACVLMRETGGSCTGELPQAWREEEGVYEARSSLADLGARFDST